jgi:hypothetical protein
MIEPTDIAAERRRRDLREQLRKCVELEAQANADGNAVLAAAARAEREELQRGAA